MSRAPSRPHLFSLGPSLVILSHFSAPFSSVSLSRALSTDHRFSAALTRPFSSADAHSSSLYLYLRHSQPSRPLFLPSVRDFSGKALATAVTRPKFFFFSCHPQKRHEKSTPTFSPDCDGDEREWKECRVVSQKKGKPQDAVQCQQFTVRFGGIY